MPLYSAAQTLPLHIVQSIVSYVVWTKDVGSDMDKTKITTSNRHALLILMKVCHYWRSVALPLHYYSAFLALYEKGISDGYGYDADILSLGKVSENESQHHIQKLHIYLFSSAIAQPEVAIDELRYAVKQCGQLKRARNVILEIEYDWFRQPYSYSNPKDVTAVDNLKRICAEYARLFNELLPNRCQLVVKFAIIFVGHPDSWKTTSAQLPNYFDHLLGENITPLQLEEFQISERFVDGLNKARLQRLSINCRKDSSLYIDIIRQHSASLECLDLVHFSQSNILMLILPPGDSGVLVYPRLKKLDIGWRYSEYNDMYEQLESDPFPALGQFTCKSHLDNGSLAILKMGNSHIRKLDLDITRKAMDVIESNNIFTAGSYSVLDSMCIRFYISFPSFDSEKASRLIAMLLSLSPTTRHVRLHNTNFRDVSLFNFDDAVFPDILPSDALRTLKLDKIEFTMDQIVKLASKFTNLDRLTVTLKDYPDGGLEAPDNNEVQRWRDELKAYTSNVRTICINSTSFPNSRRYVEYVVLMASILEGVGKVAFKPYIIENKLCNPLKDVQYALKRPVYVKCEYVHSVDFCMHNSR